LTFVWRSRLIGRTPRVPSSAGAIPGPLGVNTRTTHRPARSAVLAPAAGAEAHAHPDTHAAPAGTTTATAAAAAAALAPAGPAAALLPGRPLRGDGHVRRHRRQIQRLADEVAQRDDQRGGVDRAPCRHVGGGTAGQPDLILGPEQDDV